MKGQSGGRGRQYGLMLILAFGAAMLGVMAIHKLRERRILNLLVKEKDRELFSLQYLLQKEKEEKKEAKRKTEEMRAKLYSLRAEKMELDSKILEMQSTISSLQDEQRTIGSALEEKQNEIKLMREKEAETDKENAQVVALTETLKQREDEIQDLKNRLQNSVQVLSVSTDDPSKQAANLTKTDMWSEQHEASGLKEESDYERTEGAGESLNESTTHQGDTSTSGESRGEEGRGLSDMNEITGGHLQNGADDVQGQKISDTNEITYEHSQENTGEVQGQKISDPNEITGEHMENSTNEVQGEKIKDLQDSGMQEDKTNENKVETMANQGDNSRTQDETTHNETNETTEGKADGIGGVAEVENVSSQGDTSQQLEMNAAGETKLEMPDNSQDSIGHGADQSITLARNKYMKLRDAELQKLDIHGGNHESGQESENTEVDSNHQQGESMEVKNEDGVRLDGADGNNSEKDVERAVVFADESGKDGNNNINQQMERVQEVEYENVEKPNETAADADKQKSDELQQSGENDSAVQQKTENWDRDKADQNSGENDSAVQQKTEMRDGDKADQNSQEAGESEVAGTRDTETDFRESRDEAEEDKESGEETDELEF